MRVTAKEIRRYPWFLKPFFWNQKRKYGQVLLPGLIWGRVPKLFSAVAILYGVLDRKKSPLDPVLRSLVTVRVSQINSCSFCVDINSNTLAARAGSTAKLEALAQWHDSELFSDMEKAVLGYTDSVTFTDRQVTDKQVQDLHQYLDDDGIVELTGLIAFQNMSSKFNSALDIPPQGFCKSPGGA